MFLLHIEKDCSRYYSELCSYVNASFEASRTGGEIIIDGELISKEEACYQIESLIEEVAELIRYNNEIAEPSEITKIASGRYYGLHHDMCNRYHAITPFLKNITPQKFRETLKSSTSTHDKINPDRTQF
ncbi:MAG: hypothetical protein FWE45_02090 [Firmicutes bacterium]|nr:hypothetical protein [Bacillota bacterium]